MEEKKDGGAGFFSHQIIDFTRVFSFTQVVYN